MADYADAIIACADLVGRAGAGEFEMAWDCPHVPDEPDGHNCHQVTWAAHATFKGARIQTAGHQTPTAAAMDLAERLLTDATCRCRQPVVLTDERPGCRWRLVGRRWESGCDVPPVTVSGDRGDLGALDNPNYEWCEICRGASTWIAGRRVPVVTVELPEVVSADA